MKIIQKLAIGFAALVALSGVFGLQQVAAAPADDACVGIQAAGGSCDSASGTTSFGNIVRSIISVLSIVVGAVSVIMIIVGGFRYVISSGDSNATKGAKDTIMYAIIGLIVVLFAQVLVSFVFTNARPDQPAQQATPVQP